MPRRLAITGMHEASVLHYEDGALSEEDVLVRTEIASGKHGTTFAMFDGRTFDGVRYDSERNIFMDADEGSERRPPSHENPWGTGTSGYGVVEAVGPGVTRFSVGDRVVGIMDIRESNIVHEDRLWDPGDLDPLIALCFEPAYVSIHCVRDSNIRYGDRVAVIGLGALGLLAVSIAKEAGAETVIACDFLPKRRALAEAYGADHSLDPADGDVGLAVRDLTDNMGVDVCIELTGVYPGLNTAIACTRVNGVICSAGFYQGEAHNLFLGREWHHNLLKMIVPNGCGGWHEARDYPHWNNRRAGETILSMMRQDRLKARGLINRVYEGLEEATQVFQQIQEDPDDLIKFAVDLRS